MLNFSTFTLNDFHVKTETKGDFQDCYARTLLQKRCNIEPLKIKTRLNMLNAGNDSVKTVSTACGPKIDTWPRNMKLLKNPQFLPNLFETWSKRPYLISWSF